MGCVRCGGGMSLGLGRCGGGCEGEAVAFGGCDGGGSLVHAVVGDAGVFEGGGGEAASVEA